MNFLYFPVFCVFFLPTRGHVTLTLLRDPGASDKLDLRIDGSIELGSDWRYPAVGKVMSKLRQSLRQNDRGVNENNPKVLHYNKNWSDTRHIKHTNNGRLQKHVDNILHKQDDFKFIRQDDRAVNERNPKIPGYNNDGLQKHKHDKLRKEDDFKLPNIDWMQQHKDDTYHKEDDFKFTDNTQHDRHDKLNKHDDFKYSSNEWIQQHKGNKIYKEDIDFKFPDNDWIQKHKDDTLHKVDDFKYTNNIQQYKHDKLHKHDNFKYPTNDLIQPFQGDKLNKEDDFNFPGNNWIQQHKDDKFTDNTQHDRHDKLHKHDDLRDKINDKISVHWDPDKFDYDDDIGNETSEKSDKRANPRHKRHKDAIVGVTQFETTKTTDHKVKDDERTKEFSVHMFKQTMQVFDSMKRKMGNGVMKAKVDEMARSYRDQFGDFVRQQRENSVRTKMGDQRAILHTMDTSNLILQRLVNFLKADMEKANIERSHDSTLQREVDAARNLEYKHVCTKYGYCRSDKGFTNMLQNCIKVLMTADDEKMYRARDALTEVLKTGDYSKLIDSKTDKTFKQKINRMEKKEPEDLRKALRVLLGMLQNLQTPLEDEGGNSEVVRKTAAFYTLLAMWEDAMPGDESNKLEWTDIERSLGDWRDGKRTDILEIIKALERNVNRGFKKIDPDTEVKMKEQIKIIRG
ncbi:uncharacterized protein isoform X1 [Choristoneura fumiferana]|uniref:uncharacterized protein isoform X1 n=2 Tax=Choristoneura fumiferana TaxID=7141 RepID=UPI003D15EC86